MPNFSPDTVAQIIATVVIGIIAVVGSIRGAIRGAEVGAAATRAVTQQAIDAERAAGQATEEQQRNSVRLLLSLEIDHNLDSLRTFWAEVTREELRNYSDDSDEQRRAVARDRARALLGAPVPVWAREAWNGLTPLLPLALSRTEIERANGVYSRLDTISAIRAQLAEMAAEMPYKEVWDSLLESRPQYYTVHPYRFRNNAPDL
jgi:hypothetical protein